MKHCDFCSKPSTKVNKLFAGPNDVHICNDCLDVCWEIILDFEEHPIKSDESSNVDNESLRCSFYGKGETEVEHLIAGPAVYICSECVMRFREDTA